MSTKHTITIVFGLVFFPIIVNSQNPILIPPLLIGPNFELEMTQDSHAYYPGVPVESMGFNGSILGPTLLMVKDQSVTINVLNSLGEESTVHWHGLHVAAENDGGPHSVIAPNDNLEVNFEVLDRAATYWYHPHLHHYTTKHVQLGLSGFIITKDLEEASLNLPRTYGVDDFPLVIQAKPYDSIADSILYTANTNTGAGGIDHKDSLVMVNATMNGTLDVPKQVVRLRLLNGSHMRVFNLGLSDASDFHQIGSDGGLLTQPYLTNRVIIAPGERIEVLIDFTQSSVGSSVFLKSYASELPDGIWGASNNFANGSSATYEPNVLNGADFDVLEFIITPQNATPVTTIPSTLASFSRWTESQANNTRHKFLAHGMTAGLSIGNSPTSTQPFDINRIDDTLNLDDIEIWSITSVNPDTPEKTQAHPFHIHDIQFNILDRKDSTGVITMPHPGEMGWKDVVFVHGGETVRFIAKFDDFSGPVPYMYHCHLLIHEDLGMMGQFVVLDKVFVDKNYTGAEDGSFDLPFNTFREAEAAANSGATIVFISSSDHAEAPPTILVNKRLRVELLNGPVVVK